MSSNSNPWGGERYGDRPNLDDERAYDDGFVRRGGAYGRDGGGPWEDRSFTQGAGYDPYARQTSGERGYGRQTRDDDRDAYRGGGDYRTSRYGYTDNQAAGSQLHQGYRSAFAGARGDAQGYTNQGYSAGDRSYGGQGGDRSREHYGLGRDGERGLWDRTRDEVSSWFGDDEAAARRRQDEASHHRGKGPKGYTRSDDRIREDVNDRLTDDYQLDASDIDVKVSGGEVTLDGHIQRREDKRRAEDLAEAVAGVTHVQNNLRVKPESSSSYAASGGVAQTASTDTPTAARN